MNIFILGTNHHLQFGCCNRYSDKERDDFKNYIIRLFDRHDFSVIGEEVNEDTKINYCDGFAYTIAEKIAREFNVKHIYCDPLGPEREEKRIRNRAIETNHSLEEEETINREFNPDDRKRERCWYEKIKSDLELKNTVLFICGYGHTLSFKKLLQDKGYATDAQNYAESALV